MAKILPIVRIVALISFVPLISVDCQERNNPQNPWGDWYIFKLVVSQAAFSDSAQSQLEQIRKTLDSSSLTYYSPMNDPFKYLSDVESFLSNLANNNVSDEIQELFFVEKRFRMSTPVDTTFQIGSAELTGDDINDAILVNIRRVRHWIYQRICVVTNSDTLQVEDSAVQFHPVAGSPLFWLYPSFQSAMERSLYKLDSVERYYDRAPTVFARLMAEEISDISGESVEIIIPHLQKYIETFSGRCLVVRGYLNPAAYIYYRPLNRFIVLYAP
jgi:hypothetical protein